jgi:hypothetical protein
MSKTKPLTELRDADIRRVDAVKGAANGTRFLIAKAAAPGIVSPEEVRELIADPVGDQYLGVAGEVIKAEAFEPSKPEEQIRKEQVVTTTADTTPAAVAGTEDEVAKDAAPSLEDARAVLKQAERGRRVAKLEKKIAKAKAAFGGKKAAPFTAEEPAADGEPDADDIEKTTPPVSLKKAKAAAKAARLEKRTARDRISVAKAQATLAKIGRRNSTTDQGHVDAIDTHAAALGATAHLTPTTGTTLDPAVLQKAADDRVAGAIDIIKDAIGPLFGEKLEAIRGDLTQMSGQLATIAKTSLPGGPRVVLERDGSLVAAPDGQPGLTFEQVALGKAAERYPVGSVQREVLEKAAATSAIKDLMEARDNR